MRAGLAIVLVLICSFSCSCFICDRFLFWEVTGEVRTEEVEGLRVDVTLVFDGVERRGEPGEFDELGGYMVLVGRTVACDTADEIPSPPLPDEVIVTVSRGVQEHVVSFPGSTVGFEVQEPTYARITLPDIELPF